MRALVIGATGGNAGHVVPELLRRGVDVRALVRSEQKAASARARGARETVIGDLRDPVSLRRAMDGVDGVFHLNPAFAPDEADLGVSVVRAAEATGVGKVVFSSVYHPSSSLTNHAAKRPVEEALYTADLTFVVLQPAMFMQNLAGLVGAAVQGRIAFPYSASSRMSYVDYRDVAEVAAIGMTESRLDDGTFELAAGGTTSTVELADLLSTALGRPVQAGESDPAEVLARMPASPLREGLRRMFGEYDRHGFHGGNSLILEAALGRPPRSLVAFIQELVATTR
ncbi:NmrA family NAD(P)-binding protein [Modestobacter sp. SSW1-42]|uniref:NmrA family NAD(P)-binding protein n=1 Tax=Modestobacter sp. SSW1-42 TaxID=596372 RepID=UPI0039861585